MMLLYKTAFDTETIQGINDTLVAAGVRKNCELYTTADEDSFFVCVSEALKSIRPNIKCDSRRLRTDVKKLAIELFEENKNGLENMLKLRNNFTCFRDYLQKLEFNPLEAAKFGIEGIILGLPDIEGYFICQIFAVQLHVMIYKETENKYEHIILSKDRSCRYTNNISYKDENCIHIVQKNIKKFQAILWSEENYNQMDKPLKNKKRSGTINHGIDYENCISTLLAVKCALNEKIRDFTIETNVAGYGAFDDVVLKLILENNEEHICLIQLKYKTDTITFKNAFETKNGIFHLEKYRDSYDKLPIENKENVHLIHFTNTKFKEKCPAQLDIYEESSLIKSIVNTKEQGKIFKMKDGNDECLSKLFIATEQINVTQIATGLKKEIKKCLHLTDFDLSQSCIDDIQKHFKIWNQNSTPIKCKKIRSFLYETLLSPHLYEYIPQKNDSNCYDVVINTFNQFNSAFVSEENAKILQNSIFTFIEHCFEKLEFRMYSWEKDLVISPIFDKNNTEFTLYQKHFAEIRKLNEVVKTRNVYLILSRHRKIPMALRYNQQSKQMIDSIFNSRIFEDVYKRSTVLVKENEDITEKQLGNQFVNLLKLKEKDDELFLKNLNFIKVCIGQSEKCIKLKHLVQSENETTLIETISPDVYLQLTYQTLYFGQRNLQINYYIKRLIAVPLLNQSVFREPDLFILTDYEKSVWNFNYSNVILSKASLNEIKKAIRLLCKPPHQSIHILRPVDENILELIYSDDSVKNISKHQIVKNDLEHGTIPENNIFQLFSNNKIQALCCNAGFGKTTFLKKIQEMEEQEGRCTIFLNLTTDAKLLENLHNLETSDNVRKVLGLFEKNNESIFKFRQEFFKYYFRIGKITWLVDGFDEVDIGKIQPFLNCIKNTENRILIATRTTKRAEIESNFNILCLDLLTFSKENQIEFFEKYLEGKFSSDTIRRKLNSLSKLDEELIGIPLQTKLLADLFEDIDDIEQTEISIVFLFENCLQKYFDSKQDKEFENKLSKLALNLFFTQDLLVNIGLFSKEIEYMKKAFRENEKKDFIISDFTDQNEPIFTHRTYAEYLCAKWLVQKLKDKESVQLYKNLYKKLFCKTLTQVRILFDKIVSEKLKLHSAVLNEDIETVKKLLENDVELLNKTDDFGRTALHIASSYGKSLIIHTQDDIQGIKSGGEFIHFSINNNDFQIEEVNLHEEESFTISDDIVEYMLEKGAKNIKDKLLEENVIGYGLKSCSLNICNKLCSKFTAGQQNISCEIPIIFYFSVKYGLNDLFNFFLDEHLDVANTVKYNKENLLFLAVKNDNVQIVKNLCQIGINIEDEVDDTTVLSIAVKNGKLNMVKELIQNEVNFERKNVKGENILDIAKQNTQQDILNYLETVILKKFGASEGNSELHRAAIFGDLEKCKKFIENGTQVNIINQLGYSALMCAAQMGHLEIVEYLLSEGADWKKTNTSGKTAIHLAIENGHKEIVKVKSLQTVLHTLVKDNDIDMIDDLINLGFEIDFTDNNGDTPLHIATLQGNLNALNTLLKNGADYNKLGFNASNLLHQCAFNDNVSVVDRVLSLGFAINSTNRRGNTPLHIAAQKGNLNVLNKLLEKGAEIDSTDNSGNTPLHIAAIKGNLNVLNKLLEKGADYNKLGCNQTNLLHHCAFNDNVSVLDRVLSLGFAINSTNRGGNTPLHIAELKGNLNVLKKLLKNGADYNKLASNKRNLFHSAIESDNEEILEVVYKLGININSADKDKDTPLRLAIKSKNQTLLSGLNSMVLNNYQH